MKERRVTITNRAGIHARPAAMLVQTANQFAAELLMPDALVRKSWDSLVEGDVELTVIGSRCGPFAPAIKALAEKKIDVRPLISATYPIDQAEEAFKHAQQKGTLKVLLDCK